MPFTEEQNLHLLTDAPGQLSLRMDAASAWMSHLGGGAWMSQGRDTLAFPPHTHITQALPKMFDLFEVFKLTLQHFVPAFLLRVGEGQVIRRLHHPHGLSPGVVGGGHRCRACFTFVSTADRTTGDLPVSRFDKNECCLTTVTHRTRTENGNFIS